MCKADRAVCIDDEIAAELRAIALNAAPSFPAKDQARILDPHFRLPRPRERAFQIVRAICRPLWVEQEGKTRARFGLPRARLVRRAKRNENGAGVRRLKFGGVLTQLCHVFAARQSAQVP